ncbi:MAG: PP2C family protein-serine/threonine phosphatase [Acidimicrobiales bacterium]
MTSIRAAAETHTGYVRSNNEDLAVISSDLAAIADGMGGHLGGEVAARTAIEELVEAFHRDRTASGLVAAVRRANRAIWRKSRVDRKLHGMGTTLTAAALVGGEGDADGVTTHLALVNVGDSRAYRLDRGTGDAPLLTRLTVDHSLVEEMVRQGELTPDEAAVHPHRHVLTRALGIDAEVEMDMWDLEAPPGTRLLLCSDGMTDDVPEDEIARVLAASEDPQEAARELVNRALVHGGLDNVTVVVIDVLEDGAPGEQQVLEMVPPRPPMPDIGGDDRGADVTQSMPVTRSRRRRGGGGALDAAAAVSGAEAEAAGDESVADPPAAVETSLPSGEDAGDAGGRTDPATSEVPAADPPPHGGLYDGRLDDSNPTVLAPETPIEPLLGSASVKGDPEGDTDEDTEGEADPVPATGRRAGRSMTVRAVVGGSIDGAARSGSADAVPASHARSTVLVPTRRLSKQYRDRIVTFRVFLFLLLLAALLAGLIGVVTVFQRSSFYVGLHDGQVSIYQGRPGGLLWFKPQLLETSSVTTKNLLPNAVIEVQRGISVSSYSAAKQEVSDLLRLSNELGMGPSGSTTTTTLRLSSLAGPPTTVPAFVTSTTRPSHPTTTTRPTATTTTHPATTTTAVTPTTTGVTTTSAPKKPKR